MAYLVYITRGQHFDSALRRRITLAELVKALRGDEEWAPAFDAGALEEVSAERQVVRYQNKEGDGWATLCLHAGNIVCRNPDEPTLEKMIGLAARLHAVVQGEDNECYEAGKKEAVECGDGGGKEAGEEEEKHRRSGAFLVQGGLFHAASQRLRVRFPTVLRPERQGLQDGQQRAAEGKGEVRSAGQRIRMRATEETLRAAENAMHVVEGEKQLTERAAEMQKEPRITINGAEVKRVLGKMSLPKLHGERKASAAIEGLLNPLKRL